MASLVFNEEALLTNNVYKFENRIKSSVTRYLAEGPGALLVTYFNLHENETTVDRGLKDIDQLFGRNSPLRFNRVENFPLYGFGQANPTNTDELQIEDINVEGECVILPGTIIPNPNDFFIINHLKMNNLFQVTEVVQDSMKTEGYYQIKYRLQSTSDVSFEQLELQTVNNYRCQLDAIGTDLNPIVTVEDAVRRDQIKKILADMITDYKTLFYNDRHNCFLLEKGNRRLFDMCGNEFIAKHSLMNTEGSNVIMLHEKLTEPQFPKYYQKSIYRWIEQDAPAGKVQRFWFDTIDAFNYIDSTFKRWSELDIQVILPQREPDKRSKEFIKQRDSIFTDEQVNFLRDKKDKVNTDSEYEKLLKMFVTGKLDSVSQVPLTLGNALAEGIDDSYNFFLTPVIIYIVRKVLGFN